MRFPNWTKKFHVHIEAFATIVGEIITQNGDDHMDHLNAYASWKLNQEERNYSTTRRVGIGMIFAL